MKHILAGFLILSCASISFALEPSEMLADRELETRARALDHALRCVVCQSESIASSNAQWAVEARREIRSQLSQGRSDTQIEQFFVERYGEFVLMKPNSNGSNVLLWAAPPLIFLIALCVSALHLRQRATGSGQGERALSDEENKRLRALLDE